ncbi:hypothetical protein V2J09_020832 [Rumex salicifolius]
MPKMLPQEANARSLPKFGEWDVNNPASGEGFTVLFNKARDEKRTNSSAAANKTPPSQPKNSNNHHDPNKQNKQKKLLCCFYGA